MKKARIAVAVLAAGCSVLPVIAEGSPSEAIIEADRLFYSDTTGAVEAEGNVDIQYGMSFLETELMTGNMHTNLYTVPGTIHWRNEFRRGDAILTRAIYDANSRVAEFTELEGQLDNLYLRAQAGMYNIGEGYSRIERAMVTTPSAVAKTPDYRMEAEDIEIEENNQLIARRAKFFIKNFQILSLPTYKTSIRRDDRKGSFMSFIPRPTYNHNNGFGLRARWKYPFGKDFEAFFHYAWFSRSGFKPSIGISYFGSLGKWKIHYSKEESTINDESVWVKKKPELSFDSRRFYFGGSPVYTVLNADWGRWEEGPVKGSHFGWHIGLRTDPLPLGSRTELSPRIGYGRDYYGYNDEERGDAYASLHIDHKIGSRWDTWVGVAHHIYSGKTPYGFDRPEIERRAYVGFKVQVDRLNAIGAEYVYDTQRGTLRHADYTWYRDLHSFAGTVTYRAKDHELRVRIWAKDF